MQSKHFSRSHPADLPEQAMSIPASIKKSFNNALRNQQGNYILNAPVRDEIKREKGGSKNTKMQIRTSACLKSGGTLLF